MKNIFDRIVLSAVIVSAVATASLKTTQDMVMLQSPDYTVDLQFRALILQPSSSNLYYAAQAKTLPAQGPRWSIYDLHPKYHFGFDVGATIFCNKRHTNLALNWEHFTSRTCATHTVPVSSDMVGPFFEIGPDASVYSQSAGAVCFGFDTANLTFGHDVQWGEHLHTTIFAGVNASSVRQRLTSVFSNSAETITRSIIAYSKFNGAGPACGINFAYNMVKGLQFTGKFAATVLAGHSYNATNFSSQSPALTALGFNSPNDQSTDVQKRSQVVPALEERLGLAYFFSCCGRYGVKLEVGYEARIYCNAIQSVNMGSEVDNVDVLPASVGVFARTFNRTLSNFALTGPYFAINVTF